MPLYHFHVYDDVNGASLDRTGVDLPSDAAAEREGLRFAGMVIADNATVDRCPKEWRLDVTNYLGTVVFSLNCVMQPAPAALVAPDLFVTTKRRLPVAAQ